MAPNRQRALLVCGMIGPPLFVVVFLVAGWTRPDYSPLRHPVSSLAIAESGWVQTGNFLVTGTLILAFAVGLRPAFRPHGGGTWEPLLVGLVGVGLIGAGVFVADPYSGYPPGTPMMPDEASRTTVGSLHDAFSVLVFFGLPVTCGVVAARFAKSGRRSWATYSGGTAVLFLAGFVLTSMGFSQQPALMPIGGLLQRLTLVLGLAWLTALAVRLYRGTEPSRMGAEP